MNGIQSLFDKICLLNQEYKRLEDEKGESYNLFKVIDMTSNETSVHSAFLADLLNPKGLHHMGDTFLRLFTNEFLNGMSFSTETAIVEREKYIGPVTATTGGRLDIIVTDADRTAIIIENKIYASDQENQLIRYHNYAEKNTSEHKLFYLSLDGTVHDEDKTAKHDNKELIEEEHYFTISYESDILKWLEQCREKVVDKPLIREGISHYINLIKHLTNQTMSKEMEKDLKDLILENPKYIQNLGIIREAINISVVELQRRFWELLNNIFQQIYYKEQPKHYGFNAYKDSSAGKNEVDILSLEISGSTIKMSFADDVDMDNLVITYANWNSSGVGYISDSGKWLSYNTYNKEQGTHTVATNDEGESLVGKKYPMQSWLPQFCITVKDYNQ